MAERVDKKERNGEGEGDQYELMLTLEQLESLEEELDEVGLGNLAEVEAALNRQPSPDLIEIRDAMRGLSVSDLSEIRRRIDELNQQLDKLDEE